MSALRLHRELARIWATGPGWQRLAAVNHSVIGVRFITTAFVFFAIGGVLGMLTRVQLATPNAAFMDAATYNQIFTMHGSMLANARRSSRTARAYKKARPNFEPWSMVATCRIET